MSANGNMRDAIARARSEAPTKRLREVKVGDIIQYRYSYSGMGLTQNAVSTRTVIEIIDGGARFVVEGFFNVFARNVMAHIPMHGDEQTADSEQQTAELESADKLL